MLEALRRYGNRFTIFCQSGQIRLPPKYPPLVTFREPCIYDVEPPDKEGVFHPKVWALRFTAEDGGVHYRVLCLRPMTISAIPTASILRPPKWAFYRGRRRRPMSYFRSGLPEYRPDLYPISADALQHAHHQSRRP